MIWSKIESLKSATAKLNTFSTNKTSTTTNTTKCALNEQSPYIMRENEPDGEYLETMIRKEFHMLNTVSGVRRDLSGKCMATLHSTVPVRFPPDWLLDNAGRPNCVTRFSVSPMFYLQLQRMPYSGNKTKMSIFC